MEICVRTESTSQGTGGSDVHDSGQDESARRV